MALYLRPCIACCQFDLNAAWRQTSVMRMHDLDLNPEFESLYRRL